MTWEAGEGERETKATVSIQYDFLTHLPTLRAYRCAYSTAKALTLKGCVTDEVNQNLTFKQKLLLRFHFRLGHLGFQAVQWLGRQGILGEQGLKMALGKLEAPKCAACLFGKQGRTPDGTTHTTRTTEGALKENKLKPGELVFSDQYESRVPGRSFQGRGASASPKFIGGTIFVDAASGYTHVEHQEGLASAETIQSKVKFEKEAYTSGVTVHAYHTDNGIYKSQDFLLELAEKGQGATMSGVSAHHQNGVAENAIKIVTQKARTMMLHVALRWPSMLDKNLWPMALTHATHLYNQTPHPDLLQ
jgi:hypothetical protein